MIFIFPSMSSIPSLSRRERQILDILFSHDGATVATVRQELPEAPTDMAVRRLLHILEEKGHVKRRKAARGFLYVPRQSKRLAGARALQHVLDTFFEGAVDQAVATHLMKKNSKITPEQVAMLQQLIQEAEQKGR